MTRPDRPPSRRISVALLTGDSAHVLGPMLASLVGQSRPADEIVIHDGGSSDATLDLIRSFDSLLPITVVNSAHQRTVGESRRLAIDASSGDLIAIADHDDVFLPDHLAALEAHLPGPGTVVTPTALLWTPGKQIHPMSEQWDIDLPSADRQLAALVARNVITGMSLFTRADYDQFGPYRDESYVEDWDLWTRMALGGVRFVRVALPTLLYRWGHANVSSQVDRVRVAEEQLIARHEPALRRALGDTAYSHALAGRARKQAWLEVFAQLQAGEGAAARRTARPFVRSGDWRLTATAILPPGVLRQLRKFDPRNRR